MKLLDHLLKSIRDAAIFNPEVQVAPACILWPDRDRQWEAVIPVLQAGFPELLVLGEFSPEKRVGLAIWLRCVMAGKVPEITFPEGRVPVLYLPGISRQDLRAIESCPEWLKPLAELQYRGVIWSQVNARDWTVLAWLKSDQGGLGLDVAQDNETRNAMQLALYRLLDEEVEALRGKRLDKDDFNTLVTGGDPIRDLLQWLDQGEAFRSVRSENEWKAFVEVCKSQFAFNPQNNTVLAGCARLAERSGPWRAVWERYGEAPRRYPNIPAQIRQCKMPAFDLFADEAMAGGWPQWNEAQEAALRQDLQALARATASEARARLKTLEKHNASRRDLVWADLGEAPLACALLYLAQMAEGSQQTLAAGTLAEVAAGYATAGWQVDDAVLNALAQVETPQDLEPVTVAIRAVYLPWLESSARYLQSHWQERGESVPTDWSTVCKEQECILFVDGLRWDCARRLAQQLQQVGCLVEEQATWAALPSVTGTGKPAVAPIQRKSGRIAEAPAGFNFEVMNAYQLRKAIQENGYEIIEKSVSETAAGSDTHRAWTECGNLDHEGHDRGWKLAKQVDLLIREIRDRILELMHDGWKRVHVVTDHGWLLLPGGLPKVDLSAALTDSKWGRCAAIKPGAHCPERLFPWYWNPNHHFALADGVSCFKKGEEYAHGGLSLQECLIPRLTVSGEQGASLRSLKITEVAWKGLRCTVVIEPVVAGVWVDIRRHAGDPATSLVAAIKPLKENGAASVIVEDETLEGSDAVIVVTDEQGTVIAEMATVAGGIRA